MRKLLIHMNSQLKALEAPTAPTTSSKKDQKSP
jgi:hypothetical protein